MDDGGRGWVGGARAVLALGMSVLVVLGCSSKGGSPGTTTNDDGVDGSSDAPGGGGSGVGGAGASSAVRTSPPGGVDDAGGDGAGTNGGSGAGGSAGATTVTGSADAGRGGGATQAGGGGTAAQTTGGGAGGSGGATMLQAPMDQGFCEGEVSREGDVCTVCFACHFNPDGSSFCEHSEVECPDCFSPLQNLDLVQDAEGCRCANQPSLCISRNESDGVTRYLGLSCQDEHWTRVEDDPCSSDEFETACEYLEQHRLESLETVECPAEATEPVRPCRRTIEFRTGGYYTWDQVETVVGGSYECDGLDLLVIVGEERLPIGSYDPESRTLTWDGEEYR